MSRRNPAISGAACGLREGIETLSFDGQLRRACLPGLAADECRYVYFYAFLPNLLLSLHPDYVMTHTLWPRAVDRTEIVCEWLFHPDAIAAPDFDPDDAVAFWDLTNRQDWHVCEQMQLGLVAGLPARAVFPSRRTAARLRPAHPRARTKGGPPGYRWVVNLESFPRGPAHPSRPIASTGHSSRAARHEASSAASPGCWKT